MITVQNVSKTFGTRPLFEDVNVSFAPGRVIDDFKKSEAELGR